MFVLHAHWQPPGDPKETGKVLFWAETTDRKSIDWQRGRLAAKPKPREHPFCASLEEIGAIINQRSNASSVILRLPATRTGPQPSPGLIHNWELDTETPAFLALWTVHGLQLPPAKALPLLVDLPEWEVEDISFVLGADAVYWSHASALALEALSVHKIIPLLVQADVVGKTYHARWLPVLDGPKDGPRLAQLEAAMPPICRAEFLSGKEDRSPRLLLSTFLNTGCDSLVRHWGEKAQPHFLWSDDDPTHHWVKALFNEDPTVKASPAQLQSLASSHRLWLRNLSVAGDAAFRIAFRLEAPARQTNLPDWQLHYLLQARDDPSLLVPADSVWKKSGSLLTELGRRFEQPQEKLLAGLGYAARLFPSITASLKEKKPSRLLLGSNEAYGFLREAAPLLEGAGFGVLVPPWWNKPGARLGVRLKMQKKSGKEAIPGKMTLENLVNYQWELSIGETALTEAEFQALAALKTPLVQVRGQWVQLDSEQIDSAIRFWEKQKVEGEMSLLEAMQYGLGGQTEQGGLPVESVAADDWMSAWLDQIRQGDRLEQLPQPADLQAQLRPYQLYGFSWLSFFRRWGLGACLADDMGLGKTIQAIALLLHEKEMLGTLPSPALLICPTSVVANWEREIQRFAPSLKSYIHRGASRLRGDEFLQEIRSCDIVLTSYPLARLDADTLSSVEWLWVILDEAQNIKNPEAKQTQVIRKLPAGFRLALTGTPVENRLSELWSIMHFLNPGYLGSRTAFRSEFSIPIERYHDEEAVKRLRQLTGPLILRRLKTDPRVIQDLPEKVETKVYCTLTEEQATLYQAVVQDVMKQIEEKEGIERRGLVLSMLMQLKQICNHPVQYLHQGEKDSGRLALAGRSGKLERLDEMLEEILAEGDRALIFTQFAEMGSLLADYLPRSINASTQFLHGGTPAKARDQMVWRFQEDEHAPPVFILSLKAGGTGLNLTRANHVFHFDRWWNPAVENQATDRAFRIGQKRNVQVHKFVTNGTLEEMIDDMIENKKGLAQAVVGSGENWLTELSTDELRELVMLRRE